MPEARLSPTPVTITLKRRGLIGRTLKAPGVLRGHYRILRKSSGRLSSLRAALPLTAILFKSMKTHAKRINA